MTRFSKIFSTILSRIATTGSSEKNDGGAADDDGAKEDAIVSRGNQQSEFCNCKTLTKKRRGVEDETVFYCPSKQKVFRRLLAFPAFSVKADCFLRGLLLYGYRRARVRVPLKRE